MKKLQAESVDWLIYLKSGKKNKQQRKKVATRLLSEEEEAKRVVLQKQIDLTRF